MGKENKEAKRGKWDSDMQKKKKKSVNKKNTK